MILRIDSKLLLDFLVDLEIKYRLDYNVKRVVVFLEWYEFFWFVVLVYD